MGKVVFHLSNKPIGFVIEKTRTIIKSMTNNANFVNPQPSLPSLTALVNDLEKKFQVAMDGGKKKKAAMYMALKNLKEKLTLLEYYINQASGGDASKIISSGGEVKRKKSPVGILPHPSNIRTRFGFHKGEILLLYAGVKNRQIYRIRIKSLADPNRKWEELLPTGKIRVLIGDLVSGQEYAISIATQSTAGVGEWSEAIIQKAL